MVIFVWQLAVLASLTNILTAMPNVLEYMKEYTLFFFFFFPLCFKVIHYN